MYWNVWVTPNESEPAHPREQTLGLHFSTKDFFRQMANVVLVG